jgi:hypothetical protein
MNAAAVKRYSPSAFATVFATIADKYNRKELSVARMDAKYGQSKFTKDFFSNPERSMLAMLGNRYFSDKLEWLEWADLSDSSWEEAWADTEVDGFCTPVNFQDYLLEVALSNFGN